MRDLFRDLPEMVGERSRWWSDLRTDGRRLWFGVHFLGGGGNDVAVVMEEPPPRGRAWLVASLGGNLTADHFPRLVVDQDSTIIFDMIEEDYGWLGSRVLLKIDPIQGRRLDIVAPLDLSKVSWSSDSGRATATVEMSHAIASVAYMSTDTDSPRLVAIRGGTEHPAPDGRNGTGRGNEAASAFRRLEGDPVVLITNDRIGRIVGQDTSWTPIPIPVDSLRRLAWTYEGRFEQYDLDNNFSTGVRVGDRVFVGIGFYGGEGSNGVGGIAEYDAKDGSIRMHYWKEALQWATSPIKVDGDTVWLDLGHDGEGESSGGGVLVASLSSSRAIRLWAPDLIINSQPFGRTILLTSRRAVGVLVGSAVRWWTPVPSGPNGWEFVPLTPPANW